MLSGSLVLRFRFKGKKLKALYEEETGARRYPSSAIEAFFEVMTAVVAAKSTQDLRQLKWLHFEHLKGDRAGQCSMRLDAQFRLIFVVEKKGEEELLIIEIVDYH